MIAHDQNDATTSISITSLTIKVARANSPHMEKSISCASASVSASMNLLFVLPDGRLFGLVLPNANAVGREKPTEPPQRRNLLHQCANLCRKADRLAIPVDAQAAVTEARKISVSPRRTSCAMVRRTPEISVISVSTVSSSSNRAGDRYSASTRRTTQMTGPPRAWRSGHCPDCAPNPTARVR